MMLRFGEWRVVNTYARMTVLAEVMEEIGKGRGSSGAEIARNAMLGRNAVSNALLDMESTGWIVRRNGHPIQLTQRGEQMLAAWRAHTNQQEDAA